MSFLWSFLLLIAVFTQANDVDSSSSDESTSESSVVSISKSVLATTNYVEAYNSILYMLPTTESQELTEQECGSSGKEEWIDNGFQLHQPYVPIHNSGIFQPTMVEQAFYQKWLYYNRQVDNLNNDFSDISNLIYEPFFDHSFALYKNDITDNIKIILDQSNSNLQWNILHTFLKWSLIEEIDGKNQFLSLLLYVPTTQVILELITEYNSQLYDEYLQNEVVFETEPRMSFKGFEASGTTYPWDNDWTTVPLKQSRAVTNLDVNVAWYIEFMNAELLISGETEVNGNSVKYANLYLPYADGFEIAFYERSLDDSYGEFTLYEYEFGINSVHKDYIYSSSCGFNRWFDNHYAVNMINYQDDFKSIYDKVSNSGQRYILFVFLSSNADPFGRQGLIDLGIDYFFFLFTVEPNGNTVEIVGYFEDDDLANNGLVWTHNFCPEECVDAVAFESNFIDNGQYTSIAQNIEKYAAIFESNQDSDDDDDNSISISKNLKSNFNIHPHEAESENKNSNENNKKHKKNQKAVSIVLISIITTIVLVYALIQFVNMVGDSKKRKFTGSKSEIRPLKYGSTQVV